MDYHKPVHRLFGCSVVRLFGCSVIRLLLVGEWAGSLLHGCGLLFVKELFDAAGMLDMAVALPERFNFGF